MCTCESQSKTVFAGLFRFRRYAEDAQMVFVLLLCQQMQLIMACRQERDIYVSSVILISVSYKRHHFGAEHIRHYHVSPSRSVVRVKDNPVIRNSQRRSSFFMTLTRRRQPRSAVGLYGLRLIAVTVGGCNGIIYNMTWMGDCKGIVVIVGSKEIRGLSGIYRIGVRTIYIKGIAIMAIMLADKVYWFVVIPLKRCLAVSGERHLQGCWRRRSEIAERRHCGP